MPSPDLKLGLICACAIIFIWSGFIVFSRAGVIAGLTAYDVAALRFLVAGAFTLPFAWAWWPRDLPIWIQVMIALTGPGAIYSVLTFVGLSNASAAYGGVFTNGSLPIFTVLVMLAITGTAPKLGQIAAITVIVAGGVLLGLHGMSAASDDVMTGIAMFLCASAILSFYIFGVGHWKVSARGALALVNIPNAIIFLPIWWFALPSGMDQVDPMIIVAHGLFQGIGPGFLAVILFAMTAYHLGPTLTSGFSAVVPATAALLAIPVLGEIPVMLEWAGIVTVSAGLALLVLMRRQG